MADKAINELTQATTVGLTDLLVLQQNNVAKSVSGQTFINQMLNAMDGHGGISSIAKTGTSGLADTYTITYADTTTSTFIVTNGAKGDTGDPWYVWIRYASQQPTQDSDLRENPNNWIGIYSGTSSTAPTTYTSYAWFEYKGEKGDQGDPALVTAAVTYQASASPTSVPSGTWADEVPVVQQGYYLWTRTVFTIINGDGTETTRTQYSVARQGIDGTGAVSTVNNVDVDAGTQNITLYGTDIEISDSDATTVSDAIAAAGKVETVAGVGVTQGTKNVPLNGTNLPTASDDAQSIKSYVDGGISTATTNLTPKTTTVTIATTDWAGTPPQATKNATNVTASKNVIVSPNAASYTAWAEAGVRCTAQGAGTLTFTADQTPSASVTANVLILL